MFTVGCSHASLYIGRWLRIVGTSHKNRIFLFMLPSMVAGSCSQHMRLKRLEKPENTGNMGKIKILFVCHGNILTLIKNT